jgi:hypothetical protein
MDAGGSNMDSFSTLAGILFIFAQKHIFISYEGLGLTNNFDMKLPFRQHPARYNIDDFAELIWVLEGKILVLEKNLYFRPKKHWETKDFYTRKMANA